MRCSIAAVALTLAACGPSTQAPAPEPAPVEEAVVANVTISAAGAGGISAAMPMNVEALAQAAPAFLVREVAAQIEGEPFVAITLSANNEEVFRASPTSDGRHIHSIVTASSMARGPNGEIVGQSTFAQLPGGEAHVLQSRIRRGLTGLRVLHGNGWSLLAGVQAACRL